MVRIKASSAGDRVAALRALFVNHDTYIEFEKQFSRLLERRRAADARGLTIEAQGLVMTGGTGSGKSTLAKRAFNTHPCLVRESDNDPQTDVISFQVPSPATLKYVGHTALIALGYPLQRDRTAATTWELVKHHLKERQTLFLHLDEAQDLWSDRNRNEKQAVINTLKSLMQNEDWPVGLILTGMPTLNDLLNGDRQLARRFYPVKFNQISAPSHGAEVRQINETYIRKAGLEPAPDICGDDFPARLIHAGGCEFGMVIETIIDAIEDSIFEGSETVGRKHFVSAFRRKSGLSDGVSPFVI